MTYKQSLTETLDCGLWVYTAVVATTVLAWGSFLVVLYLALDQGVDAYASALAVGVFAFVLSKWTIRIKGQITTLAKTSGLGQGDEPAFRPWVWLIQCDSDMWNWKTTGVYLREEDAWAEWRKTTQHDKTPMGLKGGWRMVRYPLGIEVNPLDDGHYTMDLLILDESGKVVHRG